MAEVELRACRSCRTPLAEQARFCARCGEPTHAERRSLDAEWARQRGHHARAVWGVAVVFVGTMAALVVAAESAVAPDVVQTVGMLLVGCVAIAVIGGDALRGSFAGPADLREISTGALAGLLGYGAAAGYVFLLLAAVGGPSAEIPTPPWWTILVVAPLVEEWLDRGVAWHAMSRFAGPRTVLLTTSALFAVSHGLGGGYWLEFPHRFVAGLLFGMLRARSGSLMPGIVGHFVLNTCALQLGGE